MIALVKKLCYLIIAVLVCAAVFTVLLLIGLNTTRFYEKVVPLAVGFFFDGIDVKGVSVQTAKFRYPPRIELGGVALAYRERGTPHHVILDRVEVSRIFDFFRGEHPLVGQILMRAYEDHDADFQNMIVDLTLTRTDSGRYKVDGSGIAGKMTAGGYLLEGIHFDIRGGDPVFELRIKEANFYGGKLKADIQFEVAGRQPYTGTIVLLNIPTANLNQVYRDLERDVQGVVSGDMYGVGDAHSMQNLEVNLTTRQDMNIRSGLVGWLVVNSQLEDSLFRMMKEEVRRYPMMQYYAVDMALQSEGQHHIRIKMNMKTRKHTFVVNPTIDIQSDGDLMTTVRQLDFGLKHGSLENFYVRN